MIPKRGQFILLVAIAVFEVNSRATQNDTDHGRRLGRRPPPDPESWFNQQLIRMHYPAPYHHPPGHCDSLPPPRIWSRASDVPNGGSFGPVSPAPEVSLVARTFHGEKQVRQLGESLICLFAMVPTNEMDVIIVLDEGEKGAEMARCLLTLAEKFKFKGLRVALEAIPASERAEKFHLFTGKLEEPFSPGKDRSQYSNFVADRYTNANIIGFFDAETCFQVPVLLSYIARDDSSGGRGGRALHNLAEAGGSSWGVDDRALGCTTVVDVMWPNRFPLFFWREDLQNVRSHLAVKWGGPDACFDTAFANVTHGQSTKGYLHPRGSAHTAPFGFSQFNIIANYVFYWQPQKYVWHVPTVDLQGFKDRLAISLLSSQSTSSALPTYVNNFTFKTAAEYLGRLSYEPTIAIGMNSVSTQHTLHYSCCRLHPDLHCTAAPSPNKWERMYTLGYNPLESVANREWTKEPSAAFDEYMEAGEEFTKSLPADVRVAQVQCCAEHAAARSNGKTGLLISSEVLLECRVGT